jgi:hypothetical protein
MKKLIAAVTLSVAVVGGVAVAQRPEPKSPSEAEVQAAIDARLHELLVKLKEQRR